MRGLEGRIRNLKYVRHDLCHVHEKQVQQSLSIGYGQDILRCLRRAIAAGNNGWPRCLALCIFERKRMVNASRFRTMIWSGGRAEEKKYEL